MLLGVCFRWDQRLSGILSGRGSKKGAQQPGSAQQNFRPVGMLYKDSEIQAQQLQLR